MLDSYFGITIQFITNDFERKLGVQQILKSRFDPGKFQDFGRDRELAFTPILTGNGNKPGSRSILTLDPNLNVVKSTVILITIACSILLIYLTGFVKMAT